MTTRNFPNVVIVKINRNQSWCALEKRWLTNDSNTQHELSYPASSTTTLVAVIIHGVRRVSSPSSKSILQLCGTPVEGGSGSLHKMYVLYFDFWCSAATIKAISHPSYRSSLRTNIVEYLCTSVWVLCAPHTDGYSRFVWTAFFFF